MLSVSSDGVCFTVKSLLNFEERRIVNVRNWARVFAYTLTTRISG